MRAAIPLSPLLLLGAAKAFVGLGEEDPARERGRLVRRFLEEMRVFGGADVAWHTAFVHHAGYWSHYDLRALRSTWPLPLSANCEELAAFAEREGVLAEHPVVGDLFLLWNPAKNRFVRSGIVQVIDETGYHRSGEPQYECITIEGDTNPSRAPRGGWALRQLRTLSSRLGDRFVRWTALEPAEWFNARVDAAA